MAQRFSYDFKDFEIFRRLDRTQGRNRLPFANTQVALQFLRGYRQNRALLDWLRYWAVDEGLDVRRLSDEELIEQASWALARGRLCIVGLERPKHVAGAAGQSSATTAGQETAERPRAQPLFVNLDAPPPPPPPAPPAAPQAPEIDVGQQVAALLAAAEAGTPFCEECAKAAAAREQAAA